MPAAARDLDEFKVKRQAVFEFAGKPRVTRQGDRVTIAFASKGYCDATMAVEDAQGRIIRHLACGVLGPNAPPPFRKDSLEQAIVWDGKDDQERYVDDKDGLTARVSLGLKAAFERTLFWEPRRRASCYPPLMAAAPEGVYVCDGGTGIDHLRLYGHEGNYRRTAMKFRPGKGRIITSAKAVPVPLSQTSYPKRPADIVSAMQGSAWVEGAEWLYGGVGYGGKNRGVGCACWNARFALDYFARSFAPELDRYCVAVLDSNGSLILRIGQYGNADDGKPLAPPTPGTQHPTPRSLGGDEVALFHGAYLATHTDRRLFIADPGNGRVLSVKLGYHAEERIPLRDLPDQSPGTQRGLLP